MSRLFSFSASPRIARPFEVELTKALEHLFLPSPRSGTSAAIRVGVRPVVVEVQREHASPAAVVPIAATIREPFQRATL